MKIALLSIENLKQRGFVADDPLVVEPLRELGHSAEFVPWQQTAVSWWEYDGVIIRSTWDYQDNLAGYLDVLQQIETHTRLANPLQIARWNIDKRIYLQAVAAQGVRTVPTIWNESQTDSGLIEQWFRQLQTSEIVIKPSVGANAQDTLRFKRGEDPAALHRLFDNRSCMVQPFMSAIVEEGEFSLFYFSGEYSHAILKSPKPGDFRVQEEHGGNIQATEPAANLLTAGEKVMKCISPALLYARADFVRTEQDEFALMELELVEPSLYLRTAEDAPRSFACAINNWLAQAR